MKEDGEELSEKEDKLFKDLKQGHQISIIFLSIESSIESLTIVVSSG